MRPIILTLALLALPVLLVFPVGHANASTCTGTTSDAFTPTGPPTNAVTHTVGKFTITTENFGLCFTGAFNGTTMGKVTIVVNTSTGNGIFYGQNNFTGTVTTSSGSSSGTILAPFAASFSNGNFQGQYTLYGGTGGLKDLSGFGTIQGSLATFVGTYTATFFTS
jgi:hypothetical protein